MCTKAHTNKIIMLTKRDLILHYKVYSWGSALNLFPFTFDRFGQMRHENSIWRRIWFIFWELLYISQILFMTLRTIHYIGFTETEHLDWDYVPLMLIQVIGYGTVYSFPYIIFNKGQELNVKVYNEILKIRGKWKTF